MSSTASPLRPRELVVVVGSTGTGKSQLAVELAQHVQRLAARVPAATPRPASPSDAAGCTYASAEVISADSMQVYQGLDVVTNKVTAEEMGGIRHHLIDFLTPTQQYHLLQFCSDTQQIEQELRARPYPALPIIAGGTTYYVQHLLFPGLVVSNDMDDTEGLSREAQGDDRRLDAPLPEWAVAVLAGLSEAEQRLFQALREDASGVLRRAMTVSKDQNYLKSSVGIANPAVPDGLPPAPQGIDAAVDLEPGWRDEKILWRLLHALDPSMAKRWHPTDKRKILNSLRVLMTTGKRHSDWIQEEHSQRLQLAQEQQQKQGQEQQEQPEQEQEQEHDAERSNARVLLFWVWRRPEELTASLNARIGKMVQRGLLPQIQELRMIAHAQMAEQRRRLSPDPEAGGAEAGADLDVFDYERGIFQSIGYKEFDPFLRYIEAHPAAAQWASEQLGPLDQASAQATREVDRVQVVSHASGATKDELATAKDLFDHGIKAMQVATRQYAKKQVRWIRRVLAPEIRRAQQAAAGPGASSLPHVDLFLLDATELEHWSDHVASPAKAQLEAWLAHSPLTSPYDLPLCKEGRDLLREVLTGVALPPAPTGRKGRATRKSPPPRDLSDEEMGTSIERNEWRHCSVCSALPPYKDLIQHPTLGRYLLRLGKEGKIPPDVAGKVERELSLRDEEEDRDIRRLRGEAIEEGSQSAEPRLSDEDLAQFIPADFKADVHVRVADWGLHLRSRMHRAATQFTSKDSYIRSQRLAGVKKGLARQEEHRQDDQSSLKERLERMKLQRAAQDTHTM